MRTRFGRHLLVAGSVVVVCIGLAGCARDAGTPVYPVRGKVLFDGKPTERALVILHPVGDGGPAASRPRGQVGPDGTFALTTFGTNDGAPAGEYLVTVEWWLSPGRAGGGDDRPPVNRLPGKYAKPESSGLKVRIAAGPNELQPFELKR
ncbi:MAG: hypothetical protein U0746_11600 [Gemmataceae bacterium]